MIIWTPLFHDVWSHPLYPFQVTSNKAKLWINDRTILFVSGLLATIICVTVTTTDILFLISSFVILPRSSATSLLPSSSCYLLILSSLCLYSTKWFLRLYFLAICLSQLIKFKAPKYVLTLFFGYILISSYPSSLHSNTYWIYIN